MNHKTDKKNIDFNSSKDHNNEEDIDYESNLNYEKIAEEVFEDILNYNVKNESITQVIEKNITKHGNFTNKERLQIETNIIHVMTVSGYDIECIKPFKMKRYKD